ncbi:MAG: hypothetical protein ACRCYQ_06530, partial [Nocardioides sp.]
MSRTTLKGPASPSGPSSTSAVDLSAKRRPGEVAIRAVLAGSAFLSVVITMGILVTLAVPSLEFFRLTGISLGDFLTGLKWEPNAGDPLYGVVPLVSATFLMVL